MLLLIDGFLIYTFCLLSVLFASMEWIGLIHGLFPKSLDIILMSQNEFRIKSVNGFASEFWHSRYQKLTDTPIY